MLENMRIIERHISPEGKLTLTVAVGANGDIAVGFEGGDWHTHPDLISLWLGVKEEQAIRHFIELLLSDKLPIILSTDGGETIDPWVSDNLSETIRLLGKENCLLCYWSGKSVKV